MRKCMDMNVRNSVKREEMMGIRFGFQNIRKGSFRKVILPALVLGMLSSGVACAAVSDSADGAAGLTGGGVAVSGVAGDDSHTAVPAADGILHIVGGGKGEVSGTDNIQVKRSDDNDNTVKVSLNKNLYGLGYISATTIRVGDLYIQTNKGKDWSVSEIINLTNKKWIHEGIVSGRAATEDQLRAVENNALAAMEKHENLYAADDYEDGQDSTVVKRHSQERLVLKGGASTSTENNIRTSVDAQTGTINIKLGAELKGLTSIEAREITGLGNTTWDPAGVVDGRAATEGQLKSALSQIRAQAGTGQWTVATGKKNMTVGGQDNAVLHFKGDGNIVIGGTEKTEVTDGPALGFSLAKNITGVDSITLGAAEDAGAVKLDRTGLANGGNRITGVAAGRVETGSTDAVNGGQLYAMASQMGSLDNRVSELDSKLGKAGAGAAALASLHPYDMSAADKWNLAAGYGHYDRKDALALGIFYKATGNTMLSAGATLGSGVNMVTAGVSFKLDRGDNTIGSKEEMAREIGSLKTRLSDMEARYARLMDMLSRKN